MTVPAGGREGWFRRRFLLPWMLPKVDEAPIVGGGSFSFCQADLSLFWQRLRGLMLSVVMVAALVLSVDWGALTLHPISDLRAAAPLVVAGMAAGMLVDACWRIRRRKSTAVLLVLVDATAIGVGLVLLGRESHALVAPFLYSALAAAIVLPVSRALWVWCYDVLLAVLVVLSPPFTTGLGSPPPGAQGDSAVWVTTTVFGVLCLVEVLMLTGAVRRFAQAHQARLAYQAQRKDEFLAGVSHALRTPLTCVVGFGQLIEKDWADQLPNEVGVMLGELNQQADLMAAMVDNLVVRAEDVAGELTITLGTVDLREVASGVIRSVAWLYPDRMIRLAAGPPVIAWADNTRTRQVVRNLLSNAVQHGGDQIEVEASNGGQATLMVTDNAPGPIACGGSLRLQPFEKTSPTFASPTLGLGLPTSLRLAELMGGALTYRHTPGASTFTLTLPLSPSLGGRGSTPAVIGAVLAG